MGVVSFFFVRHSVVVDTETRYLQEVEQVAVVAYRAELRNEVQKIKSKKSRRKDGIFYKVQIMNCNLF